MAEVFKSLVLGIAIAGGIYVILEFREMIRANREAPRTPVSGPESLVGRKAKVQGSFQLAQDGRKLVGRVLVDGETWSAELERLIDDAPEIGTELEIIAVNSAKLMVSAK
jgi:membrane protein implicated in regulation of membrane protease activity